MPEKGVTGERAPKWSLLGIIPARGNSRGIPGKNLCPLGGHPLVAYTIAAAKAAKHLTKLIVSTEDPNVADVSRRYGCEVPFLRPAELARDDTAADAVVAHALRTLFPDGDLPDGVVLLQPTSPLRTARHIDEAIECFFSGGANSAISVCEVTHSPYWMFRLSGRHLVPFLESPFQRSRRQEVPVLYRPNGALYITSASLVLERQSLLEPPVLPYIMEEEVSVDIDTPLDLRLAETLLPGHPNELLLNAGHGR